MNLQKLKHAQKQFFSAYPGGFSHPDMIAIGKKHNVHKLADFCVESFAEERFNQPDELLDNWVKVVSRSSMISLFEKPKFKGFINTAMGDERKVLVDSLYEILHGKASIGFSLQCDLLKRDKLAKWTLISAVPAYYRLHDEIFMKPNTVKGIIAYFELPDLLYKPSPSWAFYQHYRAQILQMKAHIDESLKPNNPAFCGFLMMSLPNAK
ncbi:hypothetical protein [Marinagarivorans algicola]|uniref:hypothetical protein n=1 Tax=Marinagarivorans algicola TaxID=1513270 RepID=UPI0006B9E5E7|nr:hypothetical protein [Marinagarivorans algicola]